MAIQSISLSFVCFELNSCFQYPELTELKLENSKLQANDNSLKQVQTLWTNMKE